VATGEHRILPRANWISLLHGVFGSFRFDPVTLRRGACPTQLPVAIEHAYLPAAFVYCPVVIYGREILMK
jgi:hypothetical protein